MSSCLGLVCCRVLLFSLYVNVSSRVAIDNYTAEASMGSHRHHGGWAALDDEMYM